MAAILAPTMRASVGSATRPEMEALVDWPQRSGVKPTDKRAARIEGRYILHLAKSFDTMVAAFALSSTSHKEARKSLQLTLSRLRAKENEKKLPPVRQCATHGFMAEKHAPGGRVFWLVMALAGALFAVRPSALALDPKLDLSQYGHTAWRVRDGFTNGAIQSMAQTLDGYLWLGTEFGLVRFDGVHAVPWQPLR